MMMQSSGQGDLLLKHYRNLGTLAKRQLAAIIEDQPFVVEDFIAQKEMLINEIKKWHAQNKLSDCVPDVTKVLRHIIREIVDSEEQSQKILIERQEQVRKMMIVKQKNQMIQQAYEGQYFSQQLNIQK